MEDGVLLHSLLKNLEQQMESCFFDISATLRSTLGGVSDYTLPDERPEGAQIELLQDGVIEVPYPSPQPSISAAALGDMSLAYRAPFLPDNITITVHVPTVSDRSLAELRSESKPETPHLLLRRTGMDCKLPNSSPSRSKTLPLRVLGAEFWLKILSQQQCIPLGISDTWTYTHNALDNSLPASTCGMMLVAQIPYEMRIWQTKMADTLHLTDRPRGVVTWACACPHADNEPLVLKLLIIGICKLGIG